MIFGSKAGSGAAEPAARARTSARSSSKEWPAKATACGAALLAAELLGFLDRSTALDRDAGNELDFIWFRHAAGNVMGDCCDVLNEIQSGHPELTWEKIQQLLAERGSGEGETKA